MWTIKRIDEIELEEEDSVFGNPETQIFTIESDDGRICQFECMADSILYRDLSEGDEWPFDVDEGESETNRINQMAQFMDQYFQALEELDGDLEEEDL